jgi:hypothetical protein
MTLVETDNAKFILIDVNIRRAADDVEDDTPDVAQQLRDRLPTDFLGRPYVDAMMLTHPDKDHCNGLERHFHLGPIDEYPTGSGKIIIREMWSSPIVFRRVPESNALCSDAKAWAKEARRRVKQYKSIGFCPDQERIMILGEDIDGKTDDLGAILVRTGATWSMINGQFDASFSAVLLAPLLREDEGEENLLTKNNSSVIARIKLASSYEPDAARFLVGGDAEVAIWERIWEDNSHDAENLLGYDLLLAPHHCSWHSLSWDSWSELGEDAEVSTDARNALGQPRDGAVIVASSKHISDDDSDPPCIRAKREYQSILKEIEDGEFICVADHGDEPLEFDVKPGGLEKIEKVTKHVAFAAPAIGRQPIAHG